MASKGGSSPSRQPAPETHKVLFHTSEDCVLGQIPYAGLLTNHTGSGETDRILDCYAVVLLLKGTGHYRDAQGATCDLRAGDLMLLMPRVAHHYSPLPGKRWDEFFILFRGPVFDLWRRQELLSRARLLRHLEPIEYWHQRLQDVVSPSLEPLQRICVLQQVLADAFTERNIGIAPPFVTQTKELLECEPHLPLREVARQSGLSYDNFRKEFSRLVGMPPAQYRSGQSIRKACALLQSPELRVKEIAAQLGFCDEYYFSRRFRQMVGCSPSEFRKLIAASHSEQQEN